LCPPYRYRLEEAEDITISPEPLRSDQAGGGLVGWKVVLGREEEREGWEESREKALVVAKGGRAQARMRMLLNNMGKVNVNKNQAFLDLGA
jgi:hypothetical protein